MLLASYTANSLSAKIESGKGLRVGVDRCGRGVRWKSGLLKIPEETSFVSPIEINFFSNKNSENNKIVLSTKINWQLLREKVDFSFCLWITGELNSWSFIFFSFNSLIAKIYHNKTVEPDCLALSRVSWARKASFSFRILQISDANETSFIAHRIEAIALLVAIEAHLIDLEFIDAISGRKAKLLGLRWFVLLWKDELLTLCFWF